MPQQLSQRSLGVSPSGRHQQPARQITHPERAARLPQSRLSPIHGQQVVCQSADPQREANRRLRPGGPPVSREEQLRSGERSALRPSLRRRREHADSRLRGRQRRRIHGRREGSRGTRRAAGANR